jgi:hypothetical protein
MPHFSIRDVLWLTVVVGVLACWLVEHQTAAKQSQLWAQRQAQLNIALQELQGRLTATEEERATLQRLLAKSSDGRTREVVRGQNRQLSP